MVLEDKDKLQGRGNERTSAPNFKFLQVLEEPRERPAETLARCAALARDPVEDFSASSEALGRGTTQARDQTASCPGPSACERGLLSEAFNEARLLGHPRTTSLNEVPKLSPHFPHGEIRIAKAFMPPSPPKVHAPKAINVHQDLHQAHSRNRAASLEKTASPLGPPATITPAATIKAPGGFPTNPPWKLGRLINEEAKNGLPPSSPFFSSPSATKGKDPP